MLDERAEALRLAALRRYDILDTPRDEALDRVTALAARLFGVPMAMISLVDRDRVWHKSMHGFDLAEVPRAYSVCTLTIEEPDALVVRDAASDPRTSALPFVASEMALRFYAGIPLVSPEHQVLGTLCVVGRQVREVTPAELETLRSLADMVMDQLNASRQAREAMVRLERARADEAAQSAQYRTLFDTMSEGFALVEVEPQPDGWLRDYRVVEINPALQAMLGLGPDAAGSRLSEGGPPYRGWLAACAKVLKTGRSMGWDQFNPAVGRWHEIRLHKVSDTRIAQFFFDITEREDAKARQAHLFDELNHRTKNNLTVVSGLLHLQARAAPDAETRDQLLRAVSRVQSISDVHARLYKDPANDRIDLAGYLNDLCAGIAASVLDQSRLSITVVADPVEIAIERASPLGMVVNELVTNAAKYAYPPPATGEIRVTLTRDANDLALTIADDGPGLPGAPATSGIGMKLVRALTRQVGGTLTYGQAPGTTVTLALPVQRKP